MADGHHKWKSLLAISWRHIGRLMQDLDRRWRITWRHRSHDQISNFRKFKMADGRHFKNSFINISVANHPFSMKFCTLMRISIPRTVIWQKSKFWKFDMAIGRILKTFLLYFGAIFSRFVWNLDIRCTVACNHRSSDQNSNFRQLFYMAQPLCWK